MYISCTCIDFWHVCYFKHLGDECLVIMFLIMATN